MDLTIRPEYIENERVTFIADKDEKAIKINDAFTPVLSFDVKSINFILVRDNKIYISCSFTAGYVCMAELDYDKFIHMFNDHTINNQQILDKLDKLSAHVMNLMIAVGALPKDFDGEFP